MSTLNHKLRRDIRRHRANFVAVTLTVFLGITLFAASYDSFRNLEASYARTATDFRFANLTVVGGPADPAAYTDVPGWHTGVEAVEIRSVGDIPLAVSDTKLLGRVVGLPADRMPAVNQVKVLTGSYLDPARSDDVLVEEHMASHFDLKPGDTLSILGPDGWVAVRVGGVVSSPEYIWPARDRQELLTTPDNFGVVFAPEELAATLDGLNGEMVLYFTAGEPNAALEAVLRDSAAELGATAVFSRAEQPSNAALEEDLKGFEELALFFPILFLTAAGMAAYVMINRLVHAQRPHIGILLSEGFTRRQIVTHYLGYGLVPGLLGSLPGAIAGVLLARVITDLYTNLLSVPVTVIRFYPATLATALVLGVSATVLAAAAPALAASRVVPAEAMRGTVPMGPGRPSMLERLVPPLRRLPIRWRMALRGIERNGRRTVYTIIGVVLALMLILVSWGMIDTTTHLLDRQFVDIQLEDARVHFATPVPVDEVAALAGVEGVAAAEPTLDVPVVITSEGARYETALTVLAADTAMHGFFDTRGRAVGIGGEGILAGSALEAVLGVSSGDEVVIEVPALGVRAPTTLLELVDEPLGTVAYIAWNDAELLAGTSLPATSALIRYQDGVDPGSMRVALTSVPHIAAFEDTKALYNTVNDYLTLFYAFVGIMLVFGAAMAFALIFNAMSVNIAERSRETATLLAVGTERRTISRLIGTENMLVALAGIPPGLLLGYWVSSLAMSSFSSDLFSFDLHMRSSTLVWSGFAILAVAFVSQWPGLRAVGRIDIARVVKERSI